MHKVLCRYLLRLRRSSDNKSKQKRGDNYVKKNSTRQKGESRNPKQQPMSYTKYQSDMSRNVLHSAKKHAAEEEK